MNKMNETASSLWHQRGFKCWRESLEIGSAKHFTNPRETFFGFEWYSAPASRRQYCLSQFTTSHFKITKMVRALWLAERSVCMRVCKHGCGVKLFIFSRANHTSTNLKKFSSSKLDKFTLFTHSFVGWNLENRYKEGVSIFFRLSWHFKREKSVFWKHFFAKQELIKRARLRGQDFATGKNFSFNQCHTRSFAFFLGKVIL